MKFKDESLFIKIRDFLNVYIPKQRCFSKNTVISYRQSLNLFLDYLKERYKLPLHKLSFELITNDSVSGFMAWLSENRNSSDTTVNQRLMALRSFGKYVALTDPSNTAVQVVTTNVKTRKTAGKVVGFLSESALKTLLEQPVQNTKLGVRNSFYMILMYDTGGRCQELLDLKLQDFVLNGKKPFIYLTGKNEKTRTVPIMLKTVEHLRRYLDMYHPKETRNDNDFLFYTVIHGIKNQMSIDTVERFIKLYGTSAKKQNQEVPDNIHPHMLRHSRAIHLYRSGMPLVLIAEYLGHSCVNTTNVYAYADTEMKRKAIEKATGLNEAEEVQIWDNSDETIRRLYGLA